MERLGFVTPILVVPLALTIVGLLLAPSAKGGGPLLVGGIAGPDSQQGESITWNPTSFPIQYQVDGGFLGTIDNASAVQRVEEMFDVWQAVATSTIAYGQAGPILSVSPDFTDTDVDTMEEFDAVEGDCQAGNQSPIIFDADGSLFDQLIGDPNVIGFAGICSLATVGGQVFVVSGDAVMNGRFQDGIDNPTGASPNFELSAREFDAAFIHEFGHFSGLDHTQINTFCLFGSCEDLEGLPTMSPLLTGPELKTLAPDDIAWISRLYPTATFATNFGTITGAIFFSDGLTPLQGVNVIARQVDDPDTPVHEPIRIAVSAVSGFRFVGNPGQSLTADYWPCSPADSPGCPSSGFAGDNSVGSPFGSRDPALIGFYEIPGLPPGEYTVEVESIDPSFSLGPLLPPIRNPGSDEFWNEGDTRADSSSDPDLVPVSAGATVTNINIILNGTPFRFDNFENTTISSLLPARLGARREAFCPSL